MNVDLYAIIGELYVKLFAATKRIAELEGQAEDAPEPE